MPSDSTTCRPSNNPSPISRPHLPLSQHTQQPPLPFARSFARLLASLPSLGYNFAQTCPLAVLHTPPSLPACEALSALKHALFLSHSAFPFPCSTPTPWNSACTLFPRPSLTLLTSGNLWALAADTLGTPFPSPTHRLCTHPLAHPSLCSALAHSLACAPLLTLLPPTFPSYP